MPAGGAAGVVRCVGCVRRRGEQGLGTQMCKAGQVRSGLHHPSSTKDPVQAWQASTQQFQGPYSPSRTKDTPPEAAPVVLPPAT